MLALFLQSPFLFSKTIEIIAHRGASGIYPEHTFASYYEGVRAGADFIEQDVVLTKDSVPIILHDIYLEPTTNVEKMFPTRSRSDGHYYAIDFTLKEIQQLYVGERKNHDKDVVFPNRFPGGYYHFKVPTLSETLRFVNDLNEKSDKTVKIYPEIKKPEFHLKEGQDIAKIIYETLRLYGYERKTDRIYVQCFHPNTLKRFKYEFKSKMPLIQLSENISLDPREIKKYAVGIGLPISKLFTIHKKSPQLSSYWSSLKKEKLLIHPYTLRADQLPHFVHSFDEAIALLKKASVDGIFTDFPEKTRKALGQN